MMREERKLRFVVGDRGQPLDKSLRSNISATPHRGSTKRFLSWSLEKEERLDWIWRLIRIRDSILEIGEDSKSGLSSRFCTCTDVLRPRGNWKTIPG
ncbi:hypothetical protein AVEN_143943-1 [Araneus ventricosus]|uniref:Uncharacterized protein n=1 Tax=Araneus ventricosus TaxID=182803 RepID=A0A4Y2GT64_ARAVE|nr:hypothetical protein AVEN_191224-1 [Araneus ventricosus]GBM57078.1 hypothetical protein AVEN_143943-1 [Araneus ventricosus]